MSNKPKPVSEVDIPDVDKCPNCGHHIFIGETECSNCGYNVATIGQTLRQINPTVAAGTLFGFGLIFTISAIGADALAQFILVVLGIGLMLGGGLVYAFFYIYNDPLRKRR